MQQTVNKVREIPGIAPDAIPYAELIANEQPVVLKGVVRDWPLARTRSAAEATAYLKSFYNGKRVVAFVAREPATVAGQRAGTTRGHRVALFAGGTDRGPAGRTGRLIRAAALNQCLPGVDVRGTGRLAHRRASARVSGAG